MIIEIQRRPGKATGSLLMFCSVFLVVLCVATLALVLVASCPIYVAHVTMRMQKHSVTVYAFHLDYIQSLRCRVCLWDCFARRVHIALYGWFLFWYMPVLIPGYTYCRSVEWRVTAKSDCAPKIAEGGEGRQG